MLKHTEIPRRMSSAKKLNASKPSSSMITYSTLGDKLPFLLGWCNQLSVSQDCESELESRKSHLCHQKLAVEL